jgi:hypothetical protein
VSGDTVYRGAVWVQPVAIRPKRTPGTATDANQDLDFNIKSIFFYLLAGLSALSCIYIR